MDSGIEMHWASAADSGPDLEHLLGTCIEEARAGLPGGRADLAFVFLTAPHLDDAQQIPGRLAEALGGAMVVGCGAGGVIGSEKEFEQVPALSLLAGRLPDVGLHAFALEEHDLPDPDAPPHAWHEQVGVSPADDPSFVLLADPFSFPAERLIEGLDYAYPDAVKIGGVASGARRRGEQTLILGDRLLHEGAVGLALMGDLEVVPAVAQGCRGIGKPMRISACDGHLLLGLDGHPVLESLQALLLGVSEHDRSLATRSLLLGFEMDPFEPGDEGPWLIRNLLGVDAKTKGLYVGETLRRGQRVRFHVRDRDTSSEDLERTLESVRPSESDPPAAALLFSCLGRGAHLYGRPDHDARTFHDHFGAVPLGGFFCSGEIGPVGKTTHIHGYTSSFGLIRPRSN